jgi:3-hydroxyisobutyrate dehydrogenase
MIDQTRRKRIGFIGLGNMGRPMAARMLTAGFQLLVHDKNQSAAEELLAAGAQWADTPASLARGSEIICAALPGPVESEAIFWGNDGICTGAPPGAVFIDFTTNSSLLVRRMHRSLAERGVEMLDAPMSGGVEGAKRGELVLLVGGDPRVLENVQQVLVHLTKSVLHVGTIGAGSICKALHNCAVFCANLATVECLTVGVKAGVEAATLIEVFQKSGLGRNLDLQVAMPATLFQGKFSPARFAMRTARKDMGLATELARAVGVPMQLAELCEQEMEEAIVRGWEGQDNTIFLTLQEERADVQIRIQK